MFFFYRIALLYGLFVYKHTHGSGAQYKYIHDENEKKNISARVTAAAAAVIIIRDLCAARRKYICFL